MERLLQSMLVRWCDMSDLDSKNESLCFLVRAGGAGVLLGWGRTSSPREFYTAVEGVVRVELIDSRQTYLARRNSCA